MLPRVLSDLQQDLSEEKFLVVRNARVLWMDSELLKSDFPELRGLSEDCLAEWILENSSLLSSSQARCNEINKEVQSQATTRVGFRPPRYGRSCVVEAKVGAKSCGLLDIKGVGVRPERVPIYAKDCDGILSVTGALIELFFEKLIREIGRLYSADLQTVGTYAIVSLGFDGRSFMDGGAALPSVQIIRQAHVRPVKNSDLAELESKQFSMQVGCELFLRQFGLTSSSSSSQLLISKGLRGNVAKLQYGGAATLTLRAGLVESLMQRRMRRLSQIVIDCANIQLCRMDVAEGCEAKLYDFGQYKFQREFCKPLLFLVENRPLNWGLYIDERDGFQASLMSRRRNELVFSKKHRLGDALSSWSNYRPRRVTGIRKESLEIAKKFSCGLATHLEVNAQISSFVAYAIDEVKCNVDRTTRFLNLADCRIYADELVRRSTSHDLYPFKKGNDT